MRKTLFAYLFLFFVLTGCGIQRMNANMEMSTEAIQQNTEMVEKSTEAMRDFGNKGFLIPVGLLLLLPSLILIYFLRNFKK